jgi:UPF0716 protein FxsA
MEAMIVKFLVFLFILIPAAEVALFVASSQWIGVLPTFLIIVTTGIMGAYLAKKQGLETLQEIRYRFSRGQIPGDALLDGVCVLAGGILLITPGYITDITGFLLLFPPTRTPVKYAIIKFLKKKFRTNTTII